MFVLNDKTRLVVVPCLLTPSASICPPTLFFFKSVSFLFSGPIEGVPHQSDFNGHDAPGDASRDAAWSAPRNASRFSARDDSPPPPGAAPGVPPRDSAGGAGTRGCARG